MACDLVGTTKVRGRQISYYADNVYFLAEPEPRKPPECNQTNPCDPATGNKLQKDVDYTSSGSGGLTFARYYNSSGTFRTGQNMGAGWRHTYSREFDEQTERNPGTAWVGSGNQSALYGSTSDACTSGWNDIKATALSGDLSSGTASLVGDHNCAIQINGQTVAYFPVRSWAGVPDGQLYHFHTITRPNGAGIRFERVTSTTWINKVNPSLRLEYDSGSGTYTFVDEDDTRESYNTSGQLVSIEYRNGQTETLAYDLTSAQGGDDNNATLDRVTGPFGHTISFSYDTRGRLSLLATPDGNFQYDYTSTGDLDDGNLTAVTRPDLSVRQYHYEDATFPSYLTGITDENSDRFATWAYDTEGRAILSEHAGGKERVTLEYDAAGYPAGSTKLVMANGASRVYTYTVAQGRRALAMLSGDVCGTCPGGNIADRIYDANGFLESTFDWNGNETKRVRSAEGLIETLIEAKGSPEERSTSISWHPLYRLPTQIVSPKNTVDYTHDSNGNILTATVSSGVASRIWTMTYNSLGQPLTIDGPRTDVSDVTTLTYYACSTGVECGQIHTVTNALGHVTTYDSYDTSGRPTMITDANGLQTGLIYNWRGDVLTLAQTPTSGASRTTTMVYDDVGQLITLSTPDGMVLTYSYTDAHYLESITDNFGNHIEYDYDAMGNIKDEDIYDAGDTLKRAVDYAFDLNGRLDTVANGGYVSDLTFDLVGNLTDTVDPVSASTTHNYDALNRLDDTLDALAGVIDYDYDDHDNVTTVVAANGATTTFDYDDLDNLWREVSPDRGITTYTYDEAGNVLSKTDARSKVTTYAYDALNRLILETLDGGGTISYEYDVGANAIGRLNKIVDQSGSTQWSFDNFGNVTQKTQSIGAINLITSYGYDAEGRLSTMTYPSGNTVTYGYDTYLAVSVAVNGSTVLSGATYDPFGPVNAWTWGNGSTASWSYDLRGLASSIDFATDTQSIGYDNAGQVTSQLDSVLDLTYDYDLLGRLTDFTSNNTGGSGSPSGPMFSSAPVILANIQTTNNETGSPPFGNPTPWITAAVRNVGSGSVQLALGRAEVNSGAISVPETIGYIAIEASSGNFGASAGMISYEAQTTPDNVQGWGNGCYTTNFISAFGASPLVVATINKLDGGDGGWVRRCSLSPGAVGLTIDEDQFRDTERNHTTEAVGLLAFSQGFDAVFDDGVATWGIEADSVVLPAVTGSSNWVSVTLRQAYASPPIVVALSTDETSDPSAIRIRNVTATGFEAAQVEPANSDGVQGSMTMHYLAVEPGTHELPDGTRVLAATISTSSQQHGSGVSGGESWYTETYPNWPGASGSPLPATQVMTYDNNGNRSSLTEDSILYNYAVTPGSNRLQTVAGPEARTYSYDQAGNILGDGIHSYGFDDRGRFVSLDAGAAIYVHNGLGQRVKKDNGAATLFAYDEAGSHLGDYDANGAAIQETVWFDGMPVAVLEGAAIYYVHTDHLGTPRMISDGNTVLWYWQSTPFGSVAPDQDVDGDQVDFVYNLRFPGQYYDDETGFHYNYYRTYDPATGRYLESDPIGLNAGQNTYAYVGNMPTMQTDRYGLINDNSIYTGLPPRQQEALRQHRRQDREYAPVSGSFGFGGSWHGGPGGVHADSGFAFGSGGSVCIYSRRCGSFGMGAFATLGMTASGSTGLLCSGSYKSFGVAGGGGAAGTGGSSLEYSPDAGGLSGARGMYGIGVGGYGGVIECSYMLICTNEPDECNSCGNDGQ